MREALTLVRSGVPFDVAFSLDSETRAAFCIVFGELEGGKFDWARMKFEEAPG